MKRLTLLSLTMCLSLLALGQNATKPWTFWYWMYGAVSEEGIRADLKAMKDVGLGGCYLMPIRGAAERPEYGGNGRPVTHASRLFGTGYGYTRLRWFRPCWRSLDIARGIDAESCVERYTYYCYWQGN